MFRESANLLGLNNTRVDSSGTFQSNLIQEDETTVSRGSHRSGDEAHLRRFGYIPKGSLIEYISSFNFLSIYNHYTGTRCKPWDDRELDLFNGIQYLSFVLYTVGQTAFTLVLTWLINLFNVFQMMTMLPVNSFICSNVALETFVFVSSFFTTYKCFQIMKAKDDSLSLGDILKIIVRKFLRLAPVYYSMWFVIWVLTYRIGDGPIWHWSYDNVITCRDDWLETVFMVGNLNLTDMRPYYGCYQQAWPLQMDM